MNSRLDKIWFHQAVKFDFTADLTGFIWFHQAVKFDFTADLTGTGNRPLLVVLGWLGRVGSKFFHL